MDTLQIELNDPLKVAVSRYAEVSQVSTDLIYFTQHDRADHDHLDGARWELRRGEFCLRNVIRGLCSSAHSLSTWR